MDKFIKTTSPHTYLQTSFMVSFSLSTHDLSLQNISNLLSYTYVLKILLRLDVSDIQIYLQGSSLIATIHLFFNINLTLPSLSPNTVSIYLL